MANPSIILIQVIPAIPSLIADAYPSSSIFDPIPALAAIASAILGLIATGAYAPVVREAVRGQRLTIGQAFGEAANRFWSLLAAAILIVIIVALGFIALVVPGIIFLTWYAYAAPAIMLENKGALEGMAASKAFGRDKKWSTFLLFLVFIVVGIVVGIIVGLLSLGGGGKVIQTLLTIPVNAWTAVVINYTYITHGPSATAPAMQPPGGAPAGAPPVQGASRFCPFCGSPLSADAKFCPSCGKPV